MLAALWQESLRVRNAALEDFLLRQQGELQQRRLTPGVTLAPPLALQQSLTSKPDKPRRHRLSRSHVRLLDLDMTAGLVMTLLAIPASDAHPAKHGL